MRPVLILQARPEDEAAHEEWETTRALAGLAEGEARRLRLDREAPPDDLSPFSGVILGGGPACVSDAPETKPPLEARLEQGALSVLARVCTDDTPFLGLCYGIGALAHHLGGAVAKGRWSEPVGVADCAVTPEGRSDPILAGVPDRFDALTAHKEAVQALPGGCAHLVTSPTCRFQMIRYKQRVYATQFHPEATGESFGLRIRVYRDRGYFAPGEAARLLASVRGAEVPWAGVILRNFVAGLRHSASSRS